MSNIIINSEAELLEKFHALAHAGHNMRFWQKFWHEHHGYDAKERKQHWEKKFDAELNKLGLTEHQNQRATKVIVRGIEPDEVPIKTDE